MENDFNAKVYAFINYLVDTKKYNNTTVLSAFKASSKLNEIYKNYYIWDFLPENCSGWVRECYVKVGYFFALHPKHSAKINFAICIKKIKSGTIGKKFNNLLNADKDNIFERTERMIRFAKSNNVAIDYVDLLWGLIKWNKDSKEVQNVWAEKFFS